MAAFGQADIQGLINAGLGYGAAVLGAPFNVFRAAGPANPLDPANRVTMLLAYLDPDAQFQAKRPNLYGKPIWAVLADRTGLRTGDYLVGATGTYFLIAEQPLLPTAAVECNAVVSLTRAPGVDEAHEDSYGGETRATDLPLMTGWPASLLRAGRTVAGRADLPGDVSEGGFQGLLPAYATVTIRTSDRLMDGDGRTFTVSAAERTDLGWRLMLILSVS